MSAKAIREYYGKQLIARWLPEYSNGRHTIEKKQVLITPDVLEPSKGQSFEMIAQEHPWLLTDKLVVKPDQLIKRRGKAGLLAVNKTWEEVQAWVLERMQREVQVEQVKGVLNHFIVEAFVPHTQEEEYYFCIVSNREGEEILFTHEGGVDIGDVDAKALRIQVPLQQQPDPVAIKKALLVHVPADKQDFLATFLEGVLKLYRGLNFAYMEVNPLVVTGDRVVPLDLAAKIDETAVFLCGPQWGHTDFPAPFGRREFPEEAYIRELDAKTGSSLKLTVLNPSGRVWTMVAGGGASVVYADSIADLGQGHELANYGEYSGAPNEQQTFDYARTILSLMTRVKDPRGKVLIIGGGIANFTDVAATFKGIITALRSFQEELREHNITIWVRRAGPNYQEGLRIIRELGTEIKVPIKVYGPETHVTAIVPLALGLEDPKDYPEFDENSGVATVPKPAQSVPNDAADLAAPDAAPAPAPEIAHSAQHRIVTFTPESRCIVYGLQQRAVQGMLDFDFLCKRKKPSVAAMIFPFSGNHYIKFYWGTEETLIPVFQTTEEAIRRNKDVNVVVNFASFRSVHDTMTEILKFSDQIKTVAIIAEGVPESQTRDINLMAQAKGVGIIGPATVGGIKPGCFRIGNTGGMLDNIVASKLYRPGSVAYVSKSGGMSNELNNIISRNSDGVYEGVAIGGDRYPGTSFIDMLLRYNDDPQVKMMVLLGEVGGTDEYAVCEALKSKRITKPLIAWCIGTCASIFPYEVQFGHAGACARGMGETAAEKNAALKAAGALVPKTFDKFGHIIRETYDKLVASRVIVPKPEPEVPKVPLDYTWAKKLGLVRKPANFISSISDDRGDELRYAGMKISEIFDEDLGLGGVVGLLWFRRRLPAYATKFIEMVLMVTADHGPAVSGAHNTIVTARAGKDLVSSLASGLLTIGPRFGGALDDAAKMFTSAHDTGMDPAEFVKMCKTENKLIMGIGHRIKSLANPDARVVLVKEYAKKHFKNTEVLDFALGVEQITTQKRDTLILNVDGAIAVGFVDMLRSCGAFTREEADELIENGCLNGLFVLGRSIGFIGHFLDQKRLKQPLYRHPWEDIAVSAWVWVGG